MAPHPDIEAEQAHIDRAYRRLQAMRDTATAMRDGVLDHGKGGTHQAREERDVMVRQALSRLERLQLGRESLVFGRIDCEEGDRFHIGRLAVSDEDQEPLVVDWRAPIAEPFYRATGRHPMGLTRRRHLITNGPRVLGIEDEVFDLDRVDEQELGLVGEGALLAALERSRTGQMRDIVGTIQAEQDEIIRAPLHGILVVQGGPGTGKTAVALHRAAYLLYTHRFPLERQGVLVVGPNPLFMRYIEQVLPSLGETGVQMTTVSGLYPHVTATGTDSQAASRVKGDGRMRRIIAKAVRDRQRPLPKDVVIGFGAYTLRLTKGLSADVVGMVKRRPGTHNARRKQVEQIVARRLREQHSSALDRARRAQVRGEVVDNDLNEAELLRALRRDEVFVAALDRMWPVLTPEELLHDLFGAPALVELAAGDVLDDDSRRALLRRRSPTFDQVAWTRDDIALLDEAYVLLGPAKPPADGDDPTVRTFGHVVVDEAQDLSPMQLRMLARRCLAGSMTMVGDIGQATGQFPPRSWQEPLQHLDLRRESRVVELSVNYRTPSEVMEVASRLLAVAAPHLTPPSSVRVAGVGPSVVAGGRETLGARAASEAKRLHDDVGGTAVVVVPPSLLREMGDALAGVGVAEAGIDPLGETVTLVPVDTVKGLEFDSVVVVEPAKIVDESPQGLRALYVALTRCTKRLSVVHAEPLPAALAEALVPAAGTTTTAPEAAMPVHEATNGNGDGDGDGAEPTTVQPALPF